MLEEKREFIKNLVAELSDDELVLVIDSLTDVRAHEQASPDGKSSALDRISESAGLDELKAEMMRLGATKQQADSKSVLYALAVFAGGPEPEARKKANAILRNAAARFERLANEAQNKSQYCDSERTRHRLAAEACQREAKRLAEVAKQVTDDIKVQRAKLEEMETPEARDQFRKIQFFIEQAKPFLNDDSLSAKACYISGLAALLSGTEVGVQMPDIPPVRQAAPKDDPWKRAPIK